MEILTLLKANIRHKKGSFVSIIILMLIVSMAFTGVLSVKDNCADGVNKAHESANISDLTLFMSNHLLTDELLDSVDNHSLVKDMKVKEAVFVFDSEFGDTKNTDPWFMERLTDEYKILNDKLTDYADETPELKKGEMYCSQGVATKLGCGIGDNVKVNTIGGVEEFTVKGFVVEPMCGAMNMGLKEVFISDEDFERLQADAKNMSTPQQQADFRIINLYKNDESLSESDFKRQLNKDTGIVDYSYFTLTKSQSYHYTVIFPDMILSGLLIFVAFLVGVVLIVMAHSISTSIEMEYTSLGVLKAQGFTEGKIKMILGAQYLFAEIIGAILGVALAFPLIRFFGGIFQPILAIPCENNVSLFISIVFVVVVLVLSTIFILITTRKVGKISPMKAISGGNEDVYFGSRLNAPVSKKALSASLALRQFTSNKRRYIGTILIVTILMFFMITMTVMGTSMDSDSAVESMGLTAAELSITANESLSDEEVKEIETIVESYTEINNRYYFDYVHMSINGDDYACVTFKNPEMMIMEDGRCPEYDNEIALTDFLAKELNLKIGDKVTVSLKDKEAEYIITGINVFATDLGLNFSMPLEGAKRLGVEDTFYYGFNLEDTAQLDAMADDIQEKYPEKLTIVTNAIDPTLELYSIARNSMTAIIYVISVVFSLVVVMMFCKKAFLQERRDIGIYKSLGFTSAKLRLQFAVRFLIVSLIGSALGSLLSVLFTQNTLTAVFRFVGISSFNTDFTAMSFIVPVAIIAISFFVFSYFASSKIKKVEIKELVIE